MANVLMAATGETSQTDSFAAPESYPSGGFSHRTDLGRVDEAIAGADSGDYAIVATPADDTHILVEFYSQDGSGEVAGGTDVSSTDVTYMASRL